ncbi:MAG: sigma-70 family RNA polymerase sigma factor [Proteobacteria bacterium]|nr:sigma-70 family RNA polymerase sigma factor [Pseudomonadota bacterium]
MGEIAVLLPRLRRFARALTRDPHDADDLVQVAVERALARANQLLADAGVTGWMYAIVRNAWIDERRARARRARVLVPEELGEHVADPRQGSAADALAIEDAMQRLPQEQREAVALVLIEGLSYKEAAHVLDVPIGTLTSRIARGRSALQEMLGEDSRTP